MNYFLRMSTLLNAPFIPSLPYIGMDWVAEATRFRAGLQNDNPELEQCKSVLYELAHLNHQHQYYGRATALQFREKASAMPACLPVEAIRLVANKLMSRLSYHNNSKTDRSEYVRVRDLQEENYLKHVAATGQLVPAWVPDVYVYAEEDLQNTWLINDHGYKMRVGDPPNGGVLEWKPSRTMWILWLKVPSVGGGTRNVIVAQVHCQNQPSQSETLDLLRRAYPHSMDEPPAVNAEPHWHTNLVRAAPNPDGTWETHVRFDYMWEKMKADPVRHSVRVAKRRFPEQYENVEDTVPTLD